MADWQLQNHVGTVSVRKADSATVTLETYGRSLSHRTPLSSPSTAPPINLLSFSFPISFSFRTTIWLLPPPATETAQPRRLLPGDRPVGLVRARHDSMPCEVRVTSRPSVFPPRALGFPAPMSAARRRRGSSAPRRRLPLGGGSGPRPDACRFSGGSVEVQPRKRPDVGSGGWSAAKDARLDVRRLAARER